VLLVIYIDDIILFADDPQTLLVFIQRAITLLQSLGFTIHLDKSQLVPSQRVNFLGFILDSVVMTVSMKLDKADKAKSAILQHFRKEQPLIREVASVVRQMVSCFPGVKHAPLYYHALENDKTDALKMNGWNLDERMLMSDIAKKDMSWWLSNIDNDPCPVLPMKYKLTLKCDSSLEGWGSVIENSPLVANVQWFHSESMCHINYLEIKAVLFGLQSLCSDLTNCNIKVLSDNQTAVSYLRNMGGTHSQDCNEIARESLLWCKGRGISLTVTHLPGKQHVEADLASRHFHGDTEWSLDTHIYKSLITKWGKPEIDLFASRLNAKLPCYAAWKPDPSAYSIDAFTLDWSVYKLVYCFPPFTVIGKVLQKIIFAKTTAILRIKYCLPLKHQLIFYNTMIRPVIDYVNVVWMSCDKHCLNCVLKLQKRAARVILDADCQASSIKLFNKLNWIPFFKQAKLTKCCIIYKCLQGHVPTYLKSLLKLTSDTRSRQTRYANFNIARPVIKRKTEGGRRFTVTACQAWNSLLLSMRKIASLNSFRNSLWKKIFEEQQLLNHLIL